MKAAYNDILIDDTNLYNVNISPMKAAYNSIASLPSDRVKCKHITDESSIQPLMAYLKPYNHKFKNRVQNPKAFFK